MKTRTTQFATATSIRSCLTLAVVACGIFPALAQTTPNFGPNVYIFNPSMSSASIQSTLASLSNEAQFSTNRYAIFFTPGTYTVDSQLGYYESVGGLGQTPDSVVINGGIRVEGILDPGGNTDNATVNFWRSVENLSVTPTGGSTRWAVSQGAPFRRMHVRGILDVFPAKYGYASGGFISDSTVDGQVSSISQQQWYSRDSSFGSWAGSVWNMVFSGVLGAPAQHFPNPSYTTLSATPVSRERPFLYIDGSGNYNVFKPSVRTNSSGVSWSGGLGAGTSIPIANFFIATPANTAADINTALLSGKNLILTPGIYRLSQSINVTKANTVVLGLGYATLVPQAGTSALTVSDVDGVQVAGLIVDAGPVTSPVLLQVGNPSGTAISHQANPSAMSDVFFRIGGATAGSATTSLEVDSENVILDDIWAWRADHGNGVGWTQNTANHGLVVNADNVTATGLAVEHYQKNQVVWNGNGGETIFYQSELPYDVPSQSAWMSGSANGYSSYSVSNSVATHSAYGLGVYSYFDQGVNIVEDSAVTVPNVVGVTVTDAVSVFLNGSGSITHVVDNAGAVALQGSITSYLPFYGGVACSSNCPTSPNPPSNLSATAASASQINLSWTASTTAGVTYTVFRSTSSGFTASASNQVGSASSGTSFSDVGLTAATTYYYLVKASNSAGSSAASNQASATTQRAACTGSCTDVVAVNAGGPATGSFAADEYFSGGATASTSNAISTAAVANAAPVAVYQSERAGVFTYTIPGLTAGGAYSVRLHFAEFYWTAAGKRIFSVSINGTPVLSNFDIIAAAGGANKAIVEQFSSTSNGSGQIVISFIAGTADQPKISGIEALAGTAAPATLAINAGGPGTGSFAADEDFSGGGTASTTNAISTAGVANAAPVAVYQSERAGVFTYTIPGLVAGSSHAVRLHFAEFYWTGVGQRIFNVSINGTAVLSKFDIIAAAGGADKAVVESFTATANSSGQIVISFTSGSADQPKVSGLEVQ